MEALGCEHYQRRCRIVAPCCNEVFWCRHCHNAAKYDDEPVYRTSIDAAAFMPVPQDITRRHLLDRKAIREVVCAVCNVRQAVGSHCVNCGVLFARYFCAECKFYDDDTSKQQFHCEQCGICRVGGRQNFFHCDTCNCCYHIDMQVLAISLFCLSVFQSVM